MNLVTTQKYTFNQTTQTDWPCSQNTEQRETVRIHQRVTNVHCGVSGTHPKRAQKWYLFLGMCARRWKLEPCIHMNCSLVSKGQKRTTAAVSIAEQLNWLKPSKRDYANYEQYNYDGDEEYRADQKGAQI